ncbi:nucleotide pyrophosphatase/phosphodiesterase family protein [Cellulomonas sp. NPDC089187]|uniref:alkaline phosphatase family protein n=1 Tax=Cellulomonas sp. NPDC089187 TaxID=3154970 RepID=UPI00342A4C78
MSLRDQVRGRLERSGLMLPDYRGRSLSGVLPAAAAVLGVEVADGARRRDQFGLPRAERVCVVLVDGLGQENLAERSGHAPFLRSLLAGSKAIQVGYPSTTAASMGSFGTGTVPGRTAMLGYTVRNPNSGGLGNLVSWTGLPAAAQWQREPTVFQALVDAGVAVTSVGPRKFHGSGLTEAALRGGEHHAAEQLSERVDAAARLLRQPGLVYLYWGDVDKTGHHHGWGSWQWGDALSALDGELARLARIVPPDTTLLITADHGMVDVDPDLRWDVANDPALSAGVPLTSGEPRALHLHLDPDADPEAVQSRWQETLGRHGVVLTRDEAVGAGLFGTVADHVLPVIGDLVVATAGRATVADSRTQTPASLELIGVHGSLTSTELRVPLLIWQG